jgi:uncharacterized repeat protein (TIGR01451 family)
VTISDAGNRGATGVILTDTLPANTTFVTASDGGVLTGNVVTWNIGSLAAGASVPLLVEVRVNTPVPAGVNSITNTATATRRRHQRPGPTPPTTRASTRHFVPAPDLSLKDDGIVSVVAGQTLTYTLTFRNDGNQAATGVTLTDTLPANTSFVSASNGGALVGNVVTWNIGSVPVGSIITRTVIVQVNDPLPAGVTSITNSATVTMTATGADPTPANTDTDVDSLASTPDLVVTKTDK